MLSEYFILTRDKRNISVEADHVKILLLSKKSKSGKSVMQVRLANLHRQTLINPGGILSQDNHSIINL